MLDFSGFKETIFRQSKRNDEGVTERQRKTETLTIPGIAIFPMIMSSTSMHYWDKSDGTYTALNLQEILLPVVLPHGSTLLSIKPIASVGSWSWNLWRGNSGDELTAGNSGEKKKVNVIIDNTLNYCFYASLAQNTGVQRIEIEYVI